MLQPLLEQHKLSEENELYKAVDDFGWIKAVQSPNWEVVPQADWMSPITLADLPAKQQLGIDEI